MQPYFVSIVLSLTCLLPLRAQEPEVLSFETLSHDFGTVPERGGAVAHTFRFTNVSPNPVVLEGVSATCGCAVPRFDRQPVLPGRCGEIRVTFEPAGRRGAFEKELRAAVSGGAHYRLVIRGTVVKISPPRLPVDAGNGIALSARTADLGRIVAGSRREHRFLLYNSGPESRRITVRTGALSCLSVVCPVRLAPGATDTLRVAYDLGSREVWGTLCDTVRLLVDGRPAPVTLSVVALAVDAPRPEGPAPAAEVSRRSILLDGAPEDTLHSDFMVRNSGTAPLHIRSVECRGAGRLEADLSGSVVSPGDSVRIRVLLPPGVRRRAAVALFTDDPASPVQRLRLQTRN